VERVRGVKGVALPEKDGCCPLSLVLNKYLV
jgi:hypothetical protein